MCVTSLPPTHHCNIQWPKLFLQGFLQPHLRGTHTSWAELSHSSGGGSSGKVIWTLIDALWSLLASKHSKSSLFPWLPCIFLCGSFAGGGIKTWAVLVAHYYPWAHRERFRVCLLLGSSKSLRDDKKAVKKVDISLSHRLLCFPGYGATDPRGTANDG